MKEFQWNVIPTRPHHKLKTSLFAVILSLCGLSFLSACLTTPSINNSSFKVHNSFHMTHPRMSHTTTTLSENEVLFTGGWTMDGSPENWTRSIELFELPRGKLLKVIYMNFRHEERTVTLIGKYKVLVIGGCYASTSCKKPDPSEIIDIKTGKARIITQPTHTYRVRHSIGKLLDGRFIISGGFKQECFGCEENSVEIFNPINEQFTKINQFKLKDATFLCPLGKDKLLFAGTNAKKTDVFAEAKLSKTGLRILKEIAIPVNMFHFSPNDFLGLRTSHGIYIVSRSGPKWGTNKTSMDHYLDNNKIFQYDPVHHSIKPVNELQIGVEDYLYDSKGDSLYFLGDFPRRGLFDYPAKGFYQYSLKKNTLHHLGNIEQLPVSGSTFNISSKYILKSGGQSTDGKELNHVILYSWK